LRKERQRTIGIGHQEAAQEDAQAQAQEDVEGHEVAAPNEVAGFPLN
jgi:hypothetical protein